MFGKEKLSTYLNRSKLLSNVDCENKIRVAILGSFYAKWLGRNH